MPRYRHILLVWALALCLPFFAAGQAFAQQEIIAVDSTAVVFYTDGVKLAAQQKPAEALANFERALAIDPDHAPSLYEAAKMIVIMDGDMARAREYSSRAVELDPANRWYTQLKARALIAAQRYDEALEMFRSMLAGGSPGSDFDPDNYRMLALLYFGQGRTDEAMATLDSAELRMGPGSWIEMKRGILIEAGRLDEAIELSENHLAEAPYDEENRLALAGIYGYRGNDSLQMAALQGVLAINPDNTGALRQLADLYSVKGLSAQYFSTMRQLFMQGEVSLAEKAAIFERLAGNQTFYRRHFAEMGELAAIVATRHGGEAAAVELYADHAIRAGDSPGALSILKSRLRRSDPPLSIFRKVIEIEAYLERADSVNLYSEAALARFPGAVEIYLLQSGAQQYMGRMKEARGTLVRALETAATDSLRSEIHGAMGILWHEEGNDRRMFAEYEKALQFNSNNALILNNYAYSLAVDGRDLDRALGMASRAIRLQENYASYLDTYAWVLYRLGNYAEAKKVMQQALPLDTSGSPELLIHYGDILWAMGEEFMASVYWKRARDAGYEPATEIEQRLSRIE